VERKGALDFGGSPTPLFFTFCAAFKRNPLNLSGEPLTATLRKFPFSFTILCLIRF
jgi:hypothetical protein